ncbi:MAG TPA: hypothetical protein VFE20_04930 [Thermoleophilia bacterium]|nr:hypothetical protein [Thermoleophilia bacterium]
MKGELLNALPTGRENGTSVPALAHALGISDRECRALIEALVMEDRVPVVTTPSTKASVYIAATPEELDAGIGHISSKAGALLRRKRALRQCREHLAWKPTLFEVGS